MALSASFRRGVRRFATASTALLAACGDRPGAAASAGNTERDSAGVAIVDNRVPEWRPGSEWRVDTMPLLTLGGGDDSTQQFRFIRKGFRLGNGRVVLATDGSVRWYDSTGVFLGDLVRVGQGPGELRESWTLERLPSDSMLAAEFYGRTVVTYSPDGKLAHEERLDMSRFHALGRWKECGGDVLPDRSRVVCAADPALRDPTVRDAATEGGESGWRDPGPGLLRSYSRMHLIPASLDTSYATGVDMGIEQYGVAGGSHGTMFFVHPFHARSVVAAGGTPMVFAIATNPDYAIELYTPKGVLQRIVRLAGARRAPSEEERRAAAEGFLKQALRMYAYDSVTARKGIAKVPVPDSLPAISAMLVTSSGDLVVRRSGWAGTPSVFDVFAPNGHWQGHLDLPPRTRILDAGRDYLLVVRHDDDDTPRVEVLRLQRSPT